MDETNFLFVALPLSPWVVLAMWLHIGAPQKHKKHGFTTHFEQKFTMGSYEVGIWCAWCHWKACKACSSLVQGFVFLRKSSFFTSAQIANNLLYISNIFMG
jgi:hypothetical protein